jgi:hypothetical protein
MTDMIFGHREINHNTCGVGATGSVQKEGKSFTTVRYGKRSMRVNLQFLWT